MLADLWESWLEASRTRPFPRLVRHSVHRVFSGAESAAPGELDLSIGTILSVLAAPGAFAALLVSERYGSLLRFVRGQAVYFDPYAASFSDEYFFIVLALGVPAIIAVWKWEKLLPDRRDFLNLTPLPIRGRTIFLANISAILLLAALLSVDVNCVSCLLFPVFVTFQDSFGVFLKFFVTHAVAALLASAFGFLAVFAVMGGMMALLPYRAFRKASFYVRCALLFYLVSLLTAGSSAPSKVQVRANASYLWTRLPPPAWFLGLCESLRGFRPREFSSLGVAALWSLLLASLFAVVAFSLSFRRCYLRSAEMANVRLAGGSPGSSLFRWLDRFLLRGAFERACYRFVCKVLFRSQEHTFILGAFATVGAMLASENLLSALAARSSERAVVPSPGILSIPLIFGFFLVLGMYAAFSVPAALRSNWVFRFLADPKTQRAAALSRKLFLSFLVPLLLLPCLAVYSVYWGWRVGIVHTVLVTAWCILLVEGLLVRFRKIPFTCSVPGFKSHAIVAALFAVLGYFAFTSATATVESWAFAEPAFWLLFVPFAFGLPMLFYRQRKALTATDRELIFEEQSPAVVVSMNLGR